MLGDPPVATAPEARPKDQGTGVRPGHAHRLFRHGHSTLLPDLGDALTTKAGGVFAIAAANGDIDNRLNNGHGLYFHDTRFLERATLRLEGALLSILLSSAQEDRSVCELTNPELELNNGRLVPKDRIGIRRERLLGARVLESVQVTNFWSEPIELVLELAYTASFESMFAIRGAPVGKRGAVHPPAWTNGRLCFRYEGADGRTRTTTIDFDPVPEVAAGGRANFRVRLGPGEGTRIQATLQLRDEGPGELEMAPPEPLAPARDDVIRAGRLTLETDNELFDRVVKRSFDDLAMLAMLERGERFFAAGVPWFVALFGRDSIITGLETLAYDSSIAANTLTLLARYQGVNNDPRRDEEPGKILHELRVGEMANLQEIPHTPYYGTIDATPLFIILLADYIRWTGDLDLWVQLRPNVDRALAWIDQWSDHDHDGFSDYEARSAQSLVNQGWKDSGNSIAHQNGSLATPPVALVEVQGYVYRAKLDAAWLLRKAGDVHAAEQMEEQTEKLRQRFRSAFWLPQRKYLAVALEKGGRQVDSITSNAGQALWSGIVEPDHAAAVAQVLVSEPMFSGWGVRTMASGEGAYNPFDYQVGSIWPHDNAMIAAGLRRYGFIKESLQVFSAVFEAAVRFPYFRLPEVFAGFSREQYAVPIRYPVACNPQAWSAGTLPYMLKSALGLVPDATVKELEIRRPALPDWLGEVTVRDLHVGPARVALRYQRSADATLVAVLQRQGDLRVRIEY